MPLQTPASFPSSASHSLPIEQASGIDDDPVAMVVRLASGKPNASDLVRLSLAARTWIDSNGDIPFERCLRLPTTPNDFRLMQRDQWICQAVKLLPEGSAWTASTRLAGEWSEFLARGPWRLWRDDSDPPADASPLSRCLFYASRHNRGKCIGDKQISRIVGHVFTSKCP